MSGCGWKIDCILDTLNDGAWHCFTNIHEATLDIIPSQTKLQATMDFLLKNHFVWWQKNVHGSSEYRLAPQMRRLMLKLTETTT